MLKPAIRNKSGGAFYKDHGKLLFLCVPIVTKENNFFLEN